MGCLQLSLICRVVKNDLSMLLVLLFKLCSIDPALFPAMFNEPLLSELGELRLGFRKTCPTRWDRLVSNFIYYRILMCIYMRNTPKCIGL